jgi:hypothetical protein
MAYRSPGRKSEASFDQSYGGSMHRTSYTNVRSPSTANAGRRYILSSVPAPTGDRERRRRTFSQFLPRNPRKSLSMSVHFVGGATGKWEIQVRDQRIYVDYGAAIGDILWGVNGQ